MRKAILLGSLSFAQVAAASTSEPNHISVRTCPLYRDAGNRECWLVEANGKTYYIGQFGVGQPPELLHQVIVQGRVSDKTSCGSPVIEQLSLSVLPEIDYACDTVLPANGQRPSGPGIFDDPRLLAGAGLPPPVPAGPLVDRTFFIQFGYDSAFLNQAMQRAVEEAYVYAKAAHANAVEVVGRTSELKLDSGEMLVESPSTGNARAENVARALVALGIPSRQVNWRSISEPASADGIRDPEQRVAEIKVRVASK